MKRFIEIIDSDHQSKQLLPLNVFLGEVSSLELSAGDTDIRIIRSEKYQTDLLFMQSYHKPISRPVPKIFKNEDQ